MATNCENKVMVVGPPEAVSAFLAAARGEVDAAWCDNNATERSIIAAVRAGTPVALAFEQANRRVDALRDGVANSFLSNLTGDLRIQPVPAKGFDAWAAEIEGTRPDPAKIPKPTAFSLPGLVPPPAEVLAESYHIVGYHWALKHWGVKWGVEVEEAELVELPDGRLQATFPDFDSANEQPLEALRKASEDHPDIHVVACVFEGDHDAYGFTVLKAGEAVRSEAFERDEIPEDCILRDEPEDGEEPYEWVSRSLLFERFIYDAMVEIGDAPSFNP